MHSVYCGQCVVRTRSYARATVLACQLADVVGGVAVVQARDGHVEFRAAPTGGSLDAGDDYEIRSRACGPAEQAAG